MNFFFEEFRNDEYMVWIDGRIRLMSSSRRVGVMNVISWMR